VVGPIPVVLVVHGQTRPPKDTLLGRFATENGFALALLVLGFASQWLLPLLTAVVAGDVFASEDQHATWKTVLTRSTSRGTLFSAKTVAAAGFAVIVVVVLAASTIAASLLVVGHQPLIGLSGQTLQAPEALRLVSASWASMLPPTLGFTCLAILLSVWSRNPAVGIAAPVVLGMVMQLVGSLGGIEPLRPFLLSTPYEAWHGLLALPRFTGPLTQGLLVSGVWSAVCLATAYVLFSRRDITGD
jgi:ABC-2 type transport system permease protein